MTWKAAKFLLVLMALVLHGCGTDEPSPDDPDACVPEGSFATCLPEPTSGRINVPVRFSGNGQAGPIELSMAKVGSETDCEVIISHLAYALVAAGIDYQLVGTACVTDAARLDFQSTHHNWSDVARIDLCEYQLEFQVADMGQSHTLSIFRGTTWVEGPIALQEVSQEWIDLCP